jgi:hypothetical protein
MFEGKPNSIVASFGNMSQEIQFFISGPKQIFGG